MEHSGIKIPFFAFFSHDRGHRVKEAPTNMLVAMGLCAVGCIFIGVFPQTLYSILPYPVTTAPYTVEGVITKTQLLVFAVLAFGVLLRAGLYPKEIPSTNLNTDWFLRRPGAALLQWTVGAAARLNDAVACLGVAAARATTDMIEAMNSSAHFGRPWPTGRMALWTTLMLGAYLLLWYAV
jgi:multicomponent Na+:H+ antiporter subunit D